MAESSSSSVSRTAASAVLLCASLPYLSCLRPFIFPQSEHVVGINADDQIGADTAKHFRCTVQGVPNRDVYSTGTSGRDAVVYPRTQTNIGNRPPIMAKTITR